MTLLRALHSEQLKLKRTAALKITVIAPILIVFLMFFVFLVAAAHSTRNEWLLLERPILNMWAFLMLPLYITLQTALVAGLDHSDNQWKSLLARPVPRWTLYVAKLVVVMVMTGASTLLLLCGILIDGAILPGFRPDLLFGLPVPWSVMFRECAQVAALVFLALTIQYWVSSRARSFSVAVGVGIGATIFGGSAFAMGQQYGGWLQYFPWALPMLPLAEHPRSLGVVLSIATAAGVIVAVAGCYDFCRREVS